MDITHTEQFERRCKMFSDGMSAAEIPIVVFQCEGFGRYITKSFINLPGEGQYINPWPRSAETWDHLWKVTGPTWYYYDKWYQYLADRLPVGTIVKQVRITRPKFKSEYSAKEERWVPTKSKVERTYWYVLETKCQRIPSEYMRTFNKDGTWYDLIGTRLIAEADQVQEVMVERATIYNKSGMAIDGYRASNKWQSRERKALIQSLYNHGIKPVDYKGNTIPYNKWSKIMNKVPVSWFIDQPAAVAATDSTDYCPDNPATEELRRALGIETVDQFNKSIKQRLEQGEQP